jgi:hypothetical protein
LVKRLLIVARLKHLGKFSVPARFVDFHMDLPLDRTGIK